MWTSREQILHDADLCRNPHAQNELLLEFDRLERARQAALPLTSEQRAALVTIRAAFVEIAAATKTLDEKERDYAARLPALEAEVRQRLFDAGLDDEGGLARLATDRTRIEAMRVFFAGLGKRRDEVAARLSKVVEELRAVLVTRLDPIHLPAWMDATQRGREAMAIAAIDTLLKEQP